MDCFKSIFTFFLILFAMMHKGDCFVDLTQSMPQNFILETKKITIPDYPYAFNPSIVEWKGEYLLCFRAGKQNGSSIYADQDQKIFSDDLDSIVINGIRLDPQCGKIGLIWLDKQFQPIGRPQILTMPHYDPSYLQDPRIIVINDQLYIVYSGTLIKKGNIHRVLVAQVKLVGDSFIVKHASCLLNFENAKPSRTEKNWVPFRYQDQLLLAYSILPHKIFSPRLDIGFCQTLYTTHGHINWNWGEIRGGTQAILEGNQYLAFFHSSKNMNSNFSQDSISHYFMGAYTFSAQPPFKITGVSPYPIIDSSFYKSPPYKTWKPLKVVFPGGILANNQFIWVVYGKQDHEMWVVKMDKSKLLKSLTTVY